MATKRKGRPRRPCGGSRDPCLTCFGCDHPHPKFGAVWTLNPDIAVQLGVRWILYLLCGTCCRRGQRDPDFVDLIERRLLDDRYTPPERN